MLEDTHEIRDVIRSLPGLNGSGVELWVDKLGTTYLVADEADTQAAGLSYAAALSPDPSTNSPPARATHRSTAGWRGPRSLDALGVGFIFVSRAPPPGGIADFNIRYAVRWPRLQCRFATSGGNLPPASTSPAGETMGSYRQQWTAPALVIASLLTLFSVGSLEVAGIGLYAVMAFHTPRRTREFGIRMALGAIHSQNRDAAV